MQTNPEQDRLIVYIVKRVSHVYHVTESAALESLRKSAFYALLTDANLSYWKDDMEVNFRRYQNEIEYGAWNRNESGGIVE